MSEAGQSQAYFKISKDLSQANKRMITSRSHLTEPRQNKIYLDLSGEIIMQRKVYTTANLFSSCPPDQRLGTV